MSDELGQYVTDALERALGSMDIRPQDEAAVELARCYAWDVDDDYGRLAKLGPLLLAVLESLGMTPRGRAAVLGKGGQQNGPDANIEHGDACKCLPCQRDRLRRDRAKTMDATPS